MSQYRLCQNYHTGLFWTTNKIPVVKKFHKIQKLPSYIRQTVYTIFRFILSFQLWENGNNEFSRPQKGGNLCFIIRASHNSRLGSAVTAKSDFVSRADMVINWSKGNGCKYTFEQCLYSWHFPTEIPGRREDYSVEKIQRFRIIPHSNPNKTHCLNIEWG